MALPGWPSLLALCFGLQWTGFIISLPARTETFYDLTGSLTFIALTLWSTAGSVRHVRAMLAAGGVLLWASRLGAFLFYRVLRDK